MSPDSRAPSRDPGVSPLILTVAITAAAMAMVMAPPRADAARWNWSGSGTLDYGRLLSAPGEQALAREGAIVEWSLKATADVSEKTTATVRLCTSCHGLAVDQAYAEIRFRPQANLEAGRITVPFGDFYMRYDPASDVFLSKPLPYEMGHMVRYQKDRFNLGVLPMPYADQGAAFNGNVWIQDRLQIWYGLYGVNGFRSGVPQDFTFMDQTSIAGWSDNNRDVSWGGRLALAQGAVTAGGSYLRGAYDPAAEYDYRVWGVDGSIHALGAQFRAEYLERSTDVFDAGRRQDLKKKGFYAQLEAPAYRYITVVGRFDGLLREGPPLGTDNDAASGITRWTIGVNVAPTTDYALRAQLERWRFTDFTDLHAFHLGVVVTY